MARRAHMQGEGLHTLRQEVDVHTQLALEVVRRTQEQVAVHRLDCYLVEATACTQAPLGAYKLHQLGRVTAGVAGR